MPTRFVPNPLGVEQLTREPFLARHVSRVTGELERTAASGSPRRTGHFARSFVSDVEMTADGPVGHLDNTDAGAVAIEFGSINNPPFAPMRRACRALGLEVRESR